MKYTDFGRRDSFSGLLFSHPTHFRVEYINNPYMNLDADVGNAKENWNDCIQKIREFAHVETVDYDTFQYFDVTPSDMPDAVFAANQAMPVPEQSRFILSQMQHTARKYEPMYFRQWAEHNDYEIVEIDDTVFEGQGDAKWHPNRHLLWLGYGQRTEKEAVDMVENELDSTVIPLHLRSPMFYHLDVCFTPLNESEVIVIREAFTDESYGKIEEVFDTVYHIPESDFDTLGGNSTRITDNTVAIDRANQDTIELLRSLDFTVVEVDTSAFRNSGGSVDCLFLSLPSVTNN